MRRRLPLLIATMLLTWPAWLNGYPLVFDDTGTYLSQAVHRYAGWDRPVFYSLFLLPLHLTLTTWPVIFVQAFLAAYTLHLVGRAIFRPAACWWLVPFAAALALTTALPWFAAQLMPDIFTPLLVLALALLVLMPERLSAGETAWLVMFCAFMIAAQHSSLPLSLCLLVVLLPSRRRLGASSPLGRRGVLRSVAPLALATLALVAVNAAAFRRVSVSPFGNVFMLARVIYDGPGRNVLLNDCPAAGWRLCPVIADLPPTSDAFLWSPSSPILRAGGHKAVSADADSIILAALRAEPVAELKAWLRNGVAQLGKFATGDGLGPCTATVAPWIERDFPAFESAAYGMSRQSQGINLVPAWMQNLHRATADAGIIASAVILLVGVHRRHVAAGLAAAALLAVLGNAMIAGGLSAPHDRYGSRVMLLAPIVGVLGGAALAADRFGATRHA